MRGRPDLSWFSTRRRSDPASAGASRRRLNKPGAGAFAAAGTALMLVACAATPPAVTPPDLEAGAQRFHQQRLDPAALGLPPEPGLWRLQDWRHAAQHLNPAIQAQRASLHAAVAARKTAAQSPNPYLHFSLERVLDTGTMAWLYGAALEFLLRPRGEAQRLQQLAAVEALSMRAQLAQTQAQVDTELRRALLDLYAAALMRAPLQQQRVLRQALMDSVVRRALAGDGDLGEQVLMQTRLAEANAALAATQEAHADAHARLAAAVGVSRAALPEMHELQIETLAHPLASVIDDSTRLQALVRHPEVQHALQTYARADLQLQGQITRGRPGWRLAPGYQWDRGDRILTLDAGLELPLFHRNQAGVAEALAQRRQASLQLAAAQAAVYQRIERAEVALQAAQRAEQDASTAQHLAQTARESVQRRVELGADTRPALLASDDARIAAELQRIAARHRLRLAQAELQDALHALPPIPDIREEVAP